ncbi:serine hydrolase [Ectobacillus sp. JY-23]|uniref:D-alanyl-D-alanine carboxypeptidase family protein n=1 Tax=Ectobacillus sp. JY-23 TaxID=2933872 RepID=UPI001FF21139|nr:serine hydrolase [Ectobacillus sp. JY-23]UOY91015.1 serine hydrolase [Ectobacillus sp. JY-23]
MLKRWIHVLSITFLITGVTYITTSVKLSALSQRSMPLIKGRYAVALDAATGEVLYEKDADIPVAPASLAKLMTALLVMEKVRPDEEVVITQQARNTEAGSAKISLRVGETLKRDEAIKLLLTISVDYVAESIAEHISGSGKDFAVLMNERARELGIQATFHNASGADGKHHHASAHDLAVIAKEAVHYPAVLSAMHAVSTTVQTSAQQTEIHNNGRKELYHDPYAIASKSGHTKRAGYTLVTVDEKNGRRIITVVLQSNKENAYKDAKKITAYVLD